MTVILDLPPDLEARLSEKAARRGQGLTDYLLTLAEAAAPPTMSLDASADPTLALFAQWEVEDTVTGPEDLAVRQREGDELLAALRENRVNFEGRTDFHKLFGGDQDGAAA